MEDETPIFDLVTMNPPLVYGPIAHHLENLGSLNTSNTRIRDFVQGKVTTNELPPTGTYLFVDVRDLALAHVRAIEVPEAGGKRFFMVGGHCSHKRIVDAIRETHPGLLLSCPRIPSTTFLRMCTATITRGHGKCWGFSSGHSESVSATRRPP